MYSIRSPGITASKHKMYVIVLVLYSSFPVRALFWKENNLTIYLSTHWIVDCHQQPHFPVRARGRVIPCNHEVNLSSYLPHNSPQMMIRMVMRKRRRALYVGV